MGLSINALSTSILTELTSRKRTQKTSKKAQEALKELSKEYQMSTLGELKWFLGIYVLHNRSQRLLWLSQEAYIKKTANQYEIDLKGRLPDTPMAESELLPTDHRSIRPTLPSPIQTY